MVNFWMDKDGSKSLKFPGERMHTKPNCASTVKNDSEAEGVFNQWHI
ncbi:MAG: hypothetical protein BROFUL_01294 [Candidatus Brocadia fulgida]|jgi:hypothetical protein|uniref:Uncharacterized protein n=1 Tax=Candidatus Brocadia fulgida TaxID=380242 RepID=A0A0M2UVZ7_9BACT|nr:MAG: hypothetical protein BROFUL_01294 [Candidatus Brocadia fulgida]MBV6519524.1 hypothetical protein [Candidatus Brocadia fulgida]